MAEYWNRYFGIASNHFFTEKGKHWITRSGKQSSLPAQRNVWGYSTKGVIKDDSLTPHLEHLIAELKLPRPEMKALIEENELKFQVSCFFWNPAHDPIPIIEPKFEEVINKCGGIVFIDEYT